MTHVHTVKRTSGETVQELDPTTGEVVEVPVGVQPLDDILQRDRSPTSPSVRFRFPRKNGDGLPD